MDPVDTRALLREHVIFGVRAAQQVVSIEAVRRAGADVLAVERFIIARGGQRVDPRDDVAAIGVAAQPYWLLPPELLTAS